MINAMFINFRLRYNKRDALNHVAAINSYIPKAERRNPFDAMIYVRVTLNGKSRDLFSSNIKCPKGKWDFEKLQIICNERKIMQTLASAEYKQLAAQAHLEGINVNALLPDTPLEWMLSDEDYSFYLQNKKLKVIANKLLEIEARYNSTGKALDFDTLLAEYQGRMTTNKTLTDVCKHYLKVIKSRVGSENSETTYDIYCRYVDRVQEFLTHTKQRNVLITQIGYSFALDLKVYLLTTKGYNKNYVGRIMGFFKQVIDEAVRMEYIAHNGARTLRVGVNKAPKLEWLEPVELHRIWQAYKEGSFQGRLAAVAKAFLFCCHTGMAYIDYAILNPGRLVAEQKKKRRWKVEPATLFQIGDTWTITGNRVKTNTGYCVPLTNRNPLAMDLIREAGDLYKLAYVNNNILNVLLKQVGLMAGIQKELDFHIARKTFAHHLINIWKIPVESVVGIMGWKDIKEAEPYVKLQNSRIVSDFEMIK